MSDLNENKTDGTIEPEVSQEAASAQSAVEAAAPAEPEIMSGPELVAGAEPAKKKSVLPIIAAVIVILLAVCALSYAFVPFVKNNVKMLISKPENYYAWVEEKNLAKTADDITDAYGKVLDSASSQHKAEIELKADIDPDNMASLIGELTGTAITESGIKLPSSISIKSAAEIQDGSTKCVYDVSADGNKLASANYYMKDGKQYFQIPDLSPAYLGMDMESVMNTLLDNADIDLDVDDEDSSLMQSFIQSYTQALTQVMSDPNSVANDLISADDLNDLINRYAKIVFEDIKTVEIEKGVSCEVGGVKAKYNKLTAEIDQGALFSICKDVLNEAKTDKVLIDLTGKFGIAEDVYKSSIDDLLNQMGTLEVSGGETMLTMNVFVDSNGKICGRNFYSNEDNISVFSFMTAKDGKDTAYEIRFLPDTQDISVIGKCSEKSGKSSGDFKVALNTGNIFEIPVTFKNVETVDKAKGYCKGEFAIDLSPVEGPLLNLTLDSDGKSQSIKSDININDVNYGTVTLTSKEDTSIEIPEFDSSQKVYEFNGDSESMEEYVNEISAKLPEFINKIGSAFGLEGMGDLIGDSVASGLIDGGDTNIDIDDLDFDDSGYTGAETLYDFKKMDLQINGQSFTLPAKIPSLLDIVNVDDDKVEAGGYATYYSDDYAFGVSITNDSEAEAAPKDCIITGISVMDGAPVKFSVDGITVGSDISEAASKYSITLDNKDSGNIMITDTASSLNYISIYYYDGKINSIYFDVFDY